MDLILKSNGFHFEFHWKTRVVRLGWKMKEASLSGEARLSVRCDRVDFPVSATRVTHAMNGRAAFAALLT